MKILVYGGCHAQVISDFLSLSPALEVATVVNYQIIQSQIPFPYTSEELSSFDRFIYSPVLNKPGYNSSELFSSVSRSSSFVYPWLQWNGYFPFTTKSTPFRKDYNWWWDKELAGLKQRCSSFSAFKEVAYSLSFLDPSHILSSVERTTQMLHDREADCDYKLSSIISRLGVRKRLFLTPDHPSSEVYASLLHDIADFLGITKTDRQKQIISSNSSHTFQDDAFLPMLPCVAEALQVEFGLENRFDNRYLFGSPLDFDDFLCMHYIDDYTFRGMKLSQSSAHPSANAVLAESTRADIRSKLIRLKSIAKPFE